MRSTILIAVMILVYTAQSFFCKKYADTYPGRKDLTSPTFTVVSGLFVSVFSLVCSGFSVSVSPLTVVFGCINALALVGYNASLVNASQRGAYSVLMVFSIAGGITIPVFVSYLAFHNSVSPYKLLSLILVFVAVYLMSFKKGEKINGKKSFIFFCAALGICNGIYGTLLDVQQRITGTEEKEMMVAITYFSAFVLSLVQLWVKEKGKLPEAFRQTPKSAVYLLVCSLTVAIAINLLVYAIPLVNLAVLYTLDNAGVMLLSVIASYLFFGEKLTAKNIIGCVLMCVALVGVSLL